MAFRRKHLRGLSHIHQVAEDVVRNENARFGQAEMSFLFGEFACLQVGGGHAPEVVQASGAEVVQDFVRRDAPSGAQPGHDIFIVAGIGREYFLFVGATAVLHAGDVGFERSDVPLTAVCVEGVGGGTATQVGNALPIGGVVAGVVAGQAEVGNLVMQVSGLPEGVDQLGEEAQAEVFIHFMNLMGLPQAMQGSSFFIGQVIGREVFGMEAKGCLQVVLPVFVRLARQAVDEVDAEVAEAGVATSLHGFDGLAGGVPAVQQSQCGIVEGLYAHAEAVEGVAAQHADVVLGQVVGVGLQGDLRGILQAIHFLQGVENQGKVFFVQLGRCTPSEIDGIYPGDGQVVPAHLQLFA